MSTTLVVLVPLLLLPVVGLLAFAGCESFDAEETGPEPEPEPGPRPGPRPGPGPGPDPTPPVRPSYGEVVAGTVGLVAHWPLADPDGAVVVRDVGPSTLNGRYVDGPPDVQRGKPDGALAGRYPDDRCAGFPGEGGHVVVDHSPLLNPPAMLRFSFEVWARLRGPAARAGTSEHLASSRRFAPPPEPSAGWELFVTYGDRGVPTFTARVFDGEGPTPTVAAAVAQSVTTDPDGSWHHVVLTYDGSGDGTLTVNVRLAGEAELFPKVTTPASYAPNPDAVLRLGAGNSFAAFNHFEGDLDQAAFYNVVLTAAEVEAHHRAAQR